MTDPKAPDIRAAILAYPAADDRAIARSLHIRAWTRVRDVRAALAAEAPAPIERAVGEPVAAPEPPEPTEEPAPAPAPRRRRTKRPAPEPVVEAVAVEPPPAEPEPAPAPVVEPEPAGEPVTLIVCRHCQREGSPGRNDPTSCVACDVSPETAAVRVARLGPPPPLGATTRRVLALLREDPPDDDAAARAFRRQLLMSRAMDWAIWERA